MSTEGSSFMQAQVDRQLAVAKHSFESLLENELAFNAGDMLEILIQDATAGWSLAQKKIAGQSLYARGLVPRGYYELIPSEDALVDAQETTVSIDGVSFEIATPLASPSQSGFFSGNPHILSQEDLRPLITSARILDQLYMDTHSREVDNEQHTERSLINEELFTDSSEPAENVSHQLEPPALISEEPSILSMSQAAARLDQLFSANQTMAGMPTSSRSPLSLTRPASDIEQPVLEHIANLQPLPPIFPPMKKSQSEKKEELAARFVTTASKLHHDMNGSLKGNGNQSGGWKGSGAEAFVFDSQAFSKSERRKLGITTADDMSCQDGYLVEGGSVWHRSDKDNLSATITQSALIHTNDNSSYTSFTIETLSESLAPCIVHRRFSDFVILDTFLQFQFSALTLPPLPSKRYLGRFQAVFIENRRKDLGRWLDRLLEIPTLVQCFQVRQFFLSDDLSAWREGVATCMKTKQGVFLFENVIYQEFDLDEEKLREEVERFKIFLGDPHLSTQVTELEARIGHFRHQTRNYSQALENVSRTLLKLDNCWQEECADCSHSFQNNSKIAQALINEASIYENEINGTFLALQERLKEISDAPVRFSGLLDLASGALLAYKTANANNGQSAAESAEGNDESLLLETVAARVETILQIVGAEMDRFHSERLRDLSFIGQELLDARIELHQNALETLLRVRQDQTASIFANKGEDMKLERLPLRPASNYTLGCGSNDSPFHGSLKHFRDLLSFFAVSRIAPKAPSH